MLPPASTERSSLISVPQRDWNKKSRGCDTTSEFGSSDKAKQFFEYYDWPYHARETRWRLHGCPIGGRVVILGGVGAIRMEVTHVLIILRFLETPALAPVALSVSSFDPTLFIAFEVE